MSSHVLDKGGGLSQYLPGGGRASPGRLNPGGQACLKSLQFSGTGTSFAQGQSAVPGAPWPAFNVTTFTRQINYETASLRDDLVRSRAEMPPRGGGTPAMGELRQILVVSGDYAWNVTGETAASAPIALIERQLQLWATPHGFIRAAMAHNASASGRTIAFSSPGRFMARATLDDGGLIGKVDAVLSNPSRAIRRSSSSTPTTATSAASRFPCGSARPSAVSPPST